MAENTVEIRIRVATGDSPRVLERLAQTIRETGKSLEGIGVTGGKAGGSMQELAAKVALGNTAFAESARHIAPWTASVERARIVAEQYTARLGPVGTALAAIGPKALLAVAGIGALGVGFVKTARTAGEFNQTMANLSAITGATGKDLEFLREKAVEFSEASSIGARDVAEAFKLVASARPELLRNAEALATTTKEVIKLAEASGLPLAEASRALTTSLAQFNVSASESARFVNALAAAAQEGKAEIPELTQALVKAGTQAGEAGLSFEQTLAILEKLAESGAPAEEFGTALRNILINLGTGADNTNPKIVGFTQAIENLAGAELTATEFLDKFDKRNQTFVLQLLRHNAAQAELTTAITGTNVAQQQAEINTATYGKALERLGHAFENLSIHLQGNQSLVVAFLDTLTEAVGITDKLIRKVGELTRGPTGEGALASIGRIATETAVGGGAGAAVGSIVPGLGTGAGATVGGVTFGASQAIKELQGLGATIKEVEAGGRDAFTAIVDELNAVAGGSTRAATAALQASAATEEHASTMRIASPLAQVLAQANRENAAALRESVVAASDAAAEERRLAAARAGARVAFGDTLAALRIEVGAREDAARAGLKQQETQDLVNARQLQAQTGSRQNALAFAIEAAKRRELVTAMQGQEKAATGQESAAARAIRSAREQLVELRAEAEARRGALAAGENTITMEARVAAAKALATTGSREHAAQIFAETLAIGKLTEENERYAEAQQAVAETKDQIAALERRKTLYDELRASGASYEAIQKALVIQDEAEKAGKGELLKELTALLGVKHELAQADKDRAASDAAIHATGLEIAAAQEQIRINEALIKGEIDRAEAIRQRAVAEEEAAAAAEHRTLRPEEIESTRQLADLNEKLRKTSEQASKSVLNIGQSFSQAFSKVIEGIALGTNKGLSILDAFKQGFTASFADMFQKTLENKLSFDLEFEGNLLQALPNIVSKGVGLIKGIFGAGFADISSGFAQMLSAFTGGGGGGGGFGGILNLFSSVLGGGGGGGGVAGAFTSALSGPGGFSSILQSFGTRFLTGIGKIFSGGINLSGGVINALGKLTGLTEIAAPISALTTVLGQVVAAPFGLATPGFFAGLQAGLSGAATGISGAGVPAGFVSGAGAGATLGSAAAATGWAAIVAGAFQAALTGFALSGAREGFWDTRDATNAFKESSGLWSKTLGAFETWTTLLPLLTGGKVLGQADAFAEIQKGSWQGIVSAILNPILAVLAFTSQPQTRGTVLRQSFEEFIEGKEHGAGFFARDTGTFLRGVGQKGTREIAAAEGFEFEHAMRAYIERTGDAIKLTDEWRNAIVGLGVAFRAAVGEKAGNEAVRGIAIAADVLGSLDAAGVDAAGAIETVVEAVRNLGPPARVFKDLNEFFTSAANDIRTSDYRDAIQGLALALFHDVPQGVDVSKIAIQELDKAIGTMGEQGVVTFEQLETRIQAISAAAALAVPALHDFFFAVAGGANVTQATDAFITDINTKLAQAVAQAIFDGFIKAKFDATVLEPLFTKLNEAVRAFGAGDLPFEEFSQVLLTAGAEARATIDQLRPVFAEVAKLAQEIAQAFGLGAGGAVTDIAHILDTSADRLVEAAGTLAESVVDVATALVRLEEAQAAFNNAIDARIFALRNEGQLSPEILRRQLPAIETEFRETLIKFFPSPADQVKALQRGDTFQAEQIGRQLAGLEGPTPSERLAALAQLQALAEQDLAIRIAAIQAATAAEVRRHQQAIEHLQKERAAILDNTDALQRQIETLQDAIQVRQDELELIQEQIDQAEAWKGILEQSKDALFALRSGGLSPEAPTARLGDVQREFLRQQAIFRDTTRTDEERQAAARRVTEIGPQLLQLLQQIGIPQGSEQFRSFFTLVSSALQEIATTAKGLVPPNLEELQRRATELQEEIKDLNKDLKELNKEMRDLQRENRDKLKDIDRRIKAEQDAITAAQERGNADIARVSGNTAGVLEWIKGQGNIIFQQKQDELKAKLAELGVTDISIESIQAESLAQLKRIRELIEGQGSTVTTGGGGGGGGGQPPGKELPGGFTATGPGQFGLTSGGQEALAGAIGAYGKDKVLRERVLQALVEVHGWATQAATFDAFKSRSGQSGLAGETLRSVLALFPGATDLAAIKRVLAALWQKIKIPEGAVEILGFQRGGSFRVPGTGGPDSRVVSFAATPGETVTVSNQLEETLRTLVETLHEGGRGQPARAVGDVGIDDALADLRKALAPDDVEDALGDLREALASVPVDDALADLLAALDGRPLDRALSDLRETLVGTDLARALDELRGTLGATGLDDALGDLRATLGPGPLADALGALQEALDPEPLRQALTDLQDALGSVSLQDALGALRDALVGVAPKGPGAGPESGGRGALGGPATRLPGGFGLSGGGQDALQRQLGTLTVASPAAGVLRQLQQLGPTQVAGLAPGSAPGQYRDLVLQLFPGLGRLVERGQPQEATRGFQAIVRALLAKMQDPKTVQPLLGFARGGLVQRETVARVAEGNRPELILPLQQAVQRPEVAQALTRIVQPLVRTIAGDTYSHAETARRTKPVGSGDARRAPNVMAALPVAATMPLASPYTRTLGLPFSREAWGMRGGAPAASTVSPSLPGFARGGLVRREMLAKVGEGNRPELIVPLDRAARAPETQRAFAALAAKEAMPAGPLRALVATPRAVAPVAGLMSPPPDDRRQDRSLAREAPLARPALATALPADVGAIPLRTALRAIPPDAQRPPASLARLSAITRALPARAPDRAPAVARLPLEQVEASRSLARVAARALPLERALPPRPAPPPLAPEIRRLGTLRATPSDRAISRLVPGLQPPALPGFARGGLVRRQLTTTVGEGNRPEFILPLDPAARAPEAQRTFLALAAKERLRNGPGAIPRRPLVPTLPDAARPPTPAAAALSAVNRAFVGRGPDRMPAAARTVLGQAEFGRSIAREVVRTRPRRPPSPHSDFVGITVPAQVPRLATGGLVSRQTLALLAEKNRPELVLPLDRAMHTPAVQRVLRTLVTPMVPRQAAAGPTSPALPGAPPVPTPDLIRAMELARRGHRTGGHRTGRESVFMWQVFRDYYGRQAGRRLRDARRGLVRGMPDLDIVPGPTPHPIGIAGDWVPGPTPHPIGVAGDRVPGPTPHPTLPVDGAPPVRPTPDLVRATELARQTHRAGRDTVFMWRVFRDYFGTEAGERIRQARRGERRGGPVALAAGGLIDRRTLAWLGEEGPELVLPLRRARQSPAVQQALAALALRSEAASRIPPVARPVLPPPPLPAAAFATALARRPPLPTLSPSAPPFAFALPAPPLPPVRLSPLATLPAALMRPPERLGIPREVLRTMAVSGPVLPTANAAFGGSVGASELRRLASARPAPVPERPAFAPLETRRTPLRAPTLALPAFRERAERPETPPVAPVRIDKIEFRSDATVEVDANVELTDRESLRAALRPVILELIREALTDEVTKARLIQTVRSAVTSRRP
jgi:TP901 family phage tail tape measure protein